MNILFQKNNKTILSVNEVNSSRSFTAFASSQAACDSASCAAKACEDS